MSQVGKNKPVKVFLHCADTPDNTDKFDVGDVRRWHRSRGFTDVGYHWLIRRSGVLEKGREEFTQGAHTKTHNSNSLGICYFGKNHPSQPQIQTLLELYDRFMQLYGITYLDWYGHYEANPLKTCPGFDMNIFRRMLQEYHANNNNK